MMIKYLLLGFNGLIGFGGLAGGLLALTPSARITVGIDESMLVNSPFATFLIPGLFLFWVIGFGNLVIALLTIKKLPESPYYQCLIGLIQLFWISIQCLMLLTVNLLHIILFIFGMIQLIGGIFFIRQTKAPFPFSAHQN